MKTAKKDGQFPVTVSENRVTAKIHKVTKIRNGKTYTSYVATTFCLDNENKSSGQTLKRPSRLP